MGGAALRPLAVAADTTMAIGGRREGRRGGGRSQERERGGASGRLLASADAGALFGRELSPLRPCQFSTPHLQRRIRSFSYYYYYPILIIIIIIEFN